MSVVVQQKEVSKEELKKKQRSAALAYSEHQH
jgi:hypothetical protein